MNEIKFLWKNREKPKNLPRTIKVWLKRIYHAKSLVVILIKKNLLTQKGAHIGPLTILEKTQIIGPRKNLKIGKKCSIGECHIALHDKVIIGNNVAINDGVRILSGSHDIRDRLWKLKTAPIVIDDHAWIAQGAILLPGVKIGKGAIVGTGAVVRTDIPDYGVAVGNPAQLSKSQRVEDLVYSPAFFNARYEAWLGKAYLAPETLEPL